MPDGPVLIVGGGLAGLCCARALSLKQMPCLVLEASDDVGGRVRTDEMDGFLLDRGFQVLLTSYPEARSVLDFDAMELHSFLPGSLIYFDGQFHRFIDPWRRPEFALTAAFSSAATLPDKIRVARLRRASIHSSLDDIEQREEKTTRAALLQAGFSARIIQQFFEPFLGGVFLERELETSSRMFEFVFRMFSTGNAALPASGMQAIPRQIAAGLPPGSIRLNSPVASVGRQSVTLEGGERIEGSAVVVATESPAARKLTGGDFPAAGRSVACWYFSADEPPVDEPILLLNGEASGPVNNVCVPSQIAPGYAPRGKALISASVLGEAQEPSDMESLVRCQLRQWFGPRVDDWEHLRTYRIPYALPNQSPTAFSSRSAGVHLENGMYLCGDYRENGSIQGAMASGRKAAEAILAAR